MDLDKVGQVLFPKWDKSGVNVKDLKYFFSSEDSQDYVDESISQLLMNYYGRGKTPIDIKQVHTIEGYSNSGGYKYKLMFMLYKFRVTGVEDGVVYVELDDVLLNETGSIITKDNEDFNYFEYVDKLGESGGQNLVDYFEFREVTEYIKKYIENMFNENGYPFKIEHIYVNPFSGMDFFRKKRKNVSKINENVSPLNESEMPLSTLTDWFDKNWEKYIWETKDSNLVINKDMYKKLIDPIIDMKLTITPHPLELVVHDWEYIGPGDINLEVYLDLDHLLEYDIDHHMVAREFLIPWLDGLLKYFGFRVYRDFADINVTFYDREDGDMYTIYGDEINVDTFYRNPPRYWKKLK